MSDSDSLYVEGVWPPRLKGAMQKAPRGQRTLQREQSRAEIAKQELQHKAAAKARDGWRCRWPEAHKCRGGLEVHHVDPKGMGGDHGLKSDTSNLISLCAWLHRTGPETFQHAELKLEFETPLGCDGPVSFWRQDGGRDALGQPTYYCIGKERSIGLLEHV